jgi:hypothetical protein
VVKKLLSFGIIDNIPKVLKFFIYPILYSYGYGNWLGQFILHGSAAVLLAYVFTAPLPTMMSKMHDYFEEGDSNIAGLKLMFVDIPAVVLVIIYYLCKDIIDRDYVWIIYLFWLNANGILYKRFFLLRNKITNYLVVVISTQVLPVVVFFLFKLYQDYTIFQTFVFLVTFISLFRINSIEGPVLMEVKKAASLIPYKLSNWALAQGDRWIIDSFNGPTMVALYSIVYQSVSLVNSLGAVWVNVSFKRIYRNGDGDIQIGNMALELSRITPLILGLGFLACIALETKFEGNLGLVVLLLTAAFILQTKIVLVFNYFVSKSYYKGIALIQIAVSLVYLIITYFLVYYLGILGAAYAIYLGYSILIIVYYVYSKYIGSYLNLSFQYDFLGLIVIILTQCYLAF